MITITPTSDEAYALQRAQEHNSYAFQPLPFFTLTQTSRLTLMRRAYLDNYYAYKGQPS